MNWIYAWECMLTSSYKNMFSLKGRTTNHAVYLSRRKTLSFSHPVCIMCLLQIALLIFHRAKKNLAQEQRVKLLYIIWQNTCRLNCNYILWKMFITKMFSFLRLKLTVYQKQQKQTFSIRGVYKMYLHISHSLGIQKVSRIQSHRPLLTSYQSWLNEHNWYLPYPNFSAKFRWRHYQGYWNRKKNTDRVKV